MAMAAGAGVGVAGGAAGGSSWKPPNDRTGRVSGVGVGWPGASVGASGGAGRTVPVANAVLTSTSIASAARLEAHTFGV
jgi:hypothetical protein